MSGHIDLFTGIGGFTLAAQWTGLQTEVMCESDRRCQEFLRRTYPDIPVVPDVREFDGTRWRDRFLLTAGVPCQPASRAGKQRGKGDDRWMWPEALRVVDEARPRWCLFENPVGIYDVGLDGILADLEGLGYEIGLFEVPACAVNAPHIRQRVWIVAHAEQGRSEAIGRPERDRGIPSREADDITAKIKESSQGDLADRGRLGRREDEQEAGAQGRDADGGIGEGDVADAEKMRLGEAESRASGGERHAAERDQGDLAHTEERTERPGLCPPEQGEERWGRSGDQGGGFWSRYEWTPCADGKLRRTPSHLVGVADGDTDTVLAQLAEVHRAALGALGNAIVWPVAAQIISAIVEASE